MRAGTRESSADPNPSDAGFSLIEVIVALGILAVVLSAGSLSFIKAVAVGRTQQQRTQASDIADQYIELARAARPATLLYGWTQANIDSAWASPGPINLSQTIKPSPGATGQGTTLTPGPQTVQEQNTNFTVTYIIGQCYLPSTATANCTQTNSTGATLVYRVAVSVTWPVGRGQGCTLTGGVCAVVEDTLIDPSVDPLFNNNSG